MKVKHHRLSGFLVLAVTASMAYPICTAGYGTQGDHGSTFPGATCAQGCPDDQAGLIKGGCSGAAEEGQRGHECTDVPTTVTLHNRKKVTDIFGNCTCQGDGDFAWTWNDPNNGGPSCRGA